HDLGLDLRLVAGNVGFDAGAVQIQTATFVDRTVDGVVAREGDTLRAGFLACPFARSQVLLALTTTDPFRHDVGAFATRPAAPRRFFPIVGLTIVGRACVRFGGLLAPSASLDELLDVGSPRSWTLKVRGGI